MSTKWRSGHKNIKLITKKKVQKGTMLPYDTLRALNAY